MTFVCSLPLLCTCSSRHRRWGCTPINTQTAIDETNVPNSWLHTVNFIIGTYTIDIDVWLSINRTQNIYKRQYRYMSHMTINKSNNIYTATRKNTSFTAWYFTWVLTLMPSSQSLGSSIRQIKKTADMKYVYNTYRYTRPSGSGGQKCFRSVSVPTAYWIQIQ